MVLETDPLHVEADEPRAVRAIDRPAALVNRHARLIASLLWAGIALLAVLSNWGVPFMAGSLATFGVLLVWAEAGKR